jgi:hypothetical protein
MAKKVRILLLLSWLAGPGAVLAAGCESPPEERCAVREGSLDIDCAPSATGEWQEEAIDEAEEGFEKRSPRGRTP